MDYYTKYLKYKQKYIALKQFAAGKGSKHRQGTAGRKTAEDSTIDFSNERTNGMLIIKLIAIDLGVKKLKDKHKKLLEDWHSWLHSNSYGTSRNYLERNPEMKDKYNKHYGELPGVVETEDSDSSTGGGDNDWWARLNNAQKTNIASAYFCATFLNKTIPESVMATMRRNYGRFREMIDARDNSTKEAFLRSEWGRWVADKHMCKDIYVRHKFNAAGEIIENAISE